MDMLIKDKSLQHTDQLAPLGSLQHLRVLIKVIVYTKITTPSSPYSSLSRTMITAHSSPYSFPYPLLRYMQT